MITHSKTENKQQLGLGIYLKPEVIRMIFLGFSAGLPYPLLFATLTVWLASVEIGIAEISMFGWVGVIYAMKFLWAPMLDSLSIPLLSRTLGQRRAWMLLMQCCILIGLFCMSFFQPQTNLSWLAYLSIIIAFASATQDIAIDAYRIEIIGNRFQGAMAASYQLGYRISALLSGAGALYIAEFYSWKLAYQTMALFMLVGMTTVLVISESREQKPTQHSIHWFKESVIHPFLEFFTRNGYWSIMLLLFIALYRVSDLILNIVANPFYIDIGFKLSEIASITKVFGFIVTIFGAFVGGLSVAKYGISRPLIVSSILLAGTNLFFLLLESSGADLRILILTISADNFALGFSGSIFIAFLSSLTNRNYTATQYALFSSLMFLPGITLSGFSGQFIESVGWSDFFLFAAAMGLPAILFALIIVKKGWQEQ